MDNIQLFKEIYAHELSRKKDLDNAVATPLTIIVLLFGATFYLYNNLQIINHLWTINIYHGILISSLITLVCSITCLTVCFNRIIKGFRYTNFPYARDIFEYEEKCKELEGEFNKYLTEKYISYANTYQKINDKRSSALYYARVFIVISLFLIILAGSLFLFVKI
jgi:ABC-type uncharacterized transport system permease subunit